MRRLSVIVQAILLVLTLFVPRYAVSAQENLNEPLKESQKETVTIIAEGSAALGTDRARAEDEAVLDAKRNAIEKAVGVFLKTKAVGRNFSLEEDTIRTHTAGFLKTWERIAGTERIEKVGTNGAILHLEIRAEVALLPLLEHLQDIREAYDDLDRPRIRVQISGDTADHSARAALTQALKAEGFEVSEGAAEMVFDGQIETHPTVKLGDKNSPQSIGESIAACRSILRLSVVSETSEQNLLTFRSEATGSSFESDASAKQSAIEEAGRAFLAENKAEIIRTLLVHWATERQEGHTVVLQIQGLTAPTRARLESELAEWRGFRKILDSRTETKLVSKPGLATKGITTLRVVTLLSNREFRQRLSEIKPDALYGQKLNVTEKRGSTLHCSLSHSNDSIHSVNPNVSEKRSRVRPGERARPRTRS